VIETKTVYVAYTNTDCTEGRGYDVPIAVCEMESTAIRLARHKYVQGSDGPVRALELIKVDGRWYAPRDAVTVVPPTHEDRLAQRVLDEKKMAQERAQAVREKARAAGLTDEEIDALRHQ
jgi:hypothetical protein